MSSAIEPLLNAIAASPFRVAPDAEEQLAAVIAGHRVTLEFGDEPTLFAKFVPSRAVVRLGTPFLEVLWAASYSFIVIFDEYEQANKRKDEYFHVGASHRTAIAYSLHRQLLEAHIAKIRIPWPLPELSPVRFPAPDTDGHVANELFLTAVSWLIHHEIAHARLDHGELETVESVLQESDADRAATDWVCRDTTESGPLFKRALGIACANLHLLAYDLQQNRTRWTTHPPTYERLLVNLDRIGLEDNHKVYAFGFVLLEILLAHHGIGVTVDRTVSFHEMLANACFTVRDLGAA
ncbi:hypothetical protein LRH25_02615 [Ideonella azotifigens]|uniref:Cell death peptidase Lit n=1 Tax=Ideonella azotifigens TaxID=513160 RepID=A0ABP3VU34_9BURK|nr:phage exclusion protein Lit family protein [Ideonella azotifigens]MCD2339228.1 hypothetical protein [Ideonella azotifigens]